MVSIAAKLTSNYVKTLLEINYKWKSKIHLKSMGVIVHIGVHSHKPNNANLSNS